MQELLMKLQELKGRASVSYMEAELNAEESELAYAEGVLEGIDMAIKLVQDTIGGKE